MNGRYQAESHFPYPTVINTEAILIRTTRLTDTSLIVHWFSQERGLVKTVAKGALRPKSPFAGKLDLFYSGEISVAMARQGELHVLREVAVTAWREGLRRSYPAVLMAGYFCQLIEAGTEPGHSDPPIYLLLFGALDHLEKVEPSIKILLHFEKRMVEVLGISGGGGLPEDALRDYLGWLPSARRELFDLLGAG